MVFYNQNQDHTPKSLPEELKNVTKTVAKLEDIEKTSTNRC